MRARPSSAASLLRLFDLKWAPALELVAPGGSSALVKIEAGLLPLIGEPVVRAACGAQERVPGSREAGAGSRRGGGTCKQFANVRLP